MIMQENITANYMIMQEKNNSKLYDNARKK